MKMKTQLKLAGVIAAGLLASGCSQQMVGQQVAQQVAPAVAAPQTIVKTIVDCSKCKKPVSRPTGNKWTHTHPAIPGCTKSTRHTHPYTNRNHRHKYNCRKAPPRRPVAPRPAPRPTPPMKAPVMPQVNPNAHTHPAIPNCTNSVRHVHPNGNRPHSHRYSCRKPVVQRPVQRPVYRPVQRPVQRPVYRPVPVVPAPKVPQVKAKGTYRGPIQIDGVMQQYQN